MTLASILVTLRHQNELSRPGQLMIYPYLRHTLGRPSLTHSHAHTATRTNEAIWAAATASTCWRWLPACQDPASQHHGKWWA